MFFGRILSGDEFLGNVFWIYLVAHDLFATYLLGATRVAPTGNVGLAPSGTGPAP